MSLLYYTKCSEKLWPRQKLKFSHIMKTIRITKDYAGNILHSVLHFCTASILWHSFIDLLIIFKIISKNL